MTMTVRLAELGITLPTPPAPVASYVPFVHVGDFLIVSGQIPLEDGKLKYTGKLGADVDLATGQAAARLCAINLLAQVQAALGSLNNVARVVRLGGFIACTPDFSDHSKIVNGASDLMVELFGDLGRHARTSIGVASLPMNAAVEVEGMFAVK